MTYDEMIDMIMERLDEISKRIGYRPETAHVYTDLVNLVYMAVNAGRMDVIQDMTFHSESHQKNFNEYNAKIKGGK